MDDNVKIWETDLGVFYPGGTGIEVIQSGGSEIKLDDSGNDITIEIVNDGSGNVILLEQSATPVIDFNIGPSHEIDVTATGTIIYHPTHTYLPEVKQYLGNVNDLTAIYLGNTSITDKFSPIAHNHDARYDLRYVKIGEGGGEPIDLSDWFVIVNPGEATEYLRCKKPFAGDYEISAWSDTGWLPPDIWDSIPYATAEAVGGIKVGAGLTITDGVLSADAVGGGAWGEITGTITDQTDLVVYLSAALEPKAPLDNPAFIRTIQIGTYPHIGQRYSAMDLWLGQNIEVDPGAVNGVVLATNYTGHGASALNVGWDGLRFYRWTPDELSGKVAGDALSLGTAKINVDYQGNITPSGSFIGSNGQYVQVKDSAGIYSNYLRAVIGSANARSGIVMESNGSVNFGVNNNSSFGFRWLRDDSAVDYLTDTDVLMALTGSGALNVIGEITAFYSSDRRLKKDIQEFLALDIIDQLRPVKYHYNKKGLELNSGRDDRWYYSFVAQEMEEVLPELIHPIYEKYKGIDQEQMISILTQAVKELREEVKQLQACQRT